MSIVEEIAKQHIIKDPPNKLINFILGMINTYPKNAKFATQNKDEEVVLIMRRHISRNFQWVFTAIFLLLFPLIIHLIGDFMNISFTEAENDSEIILALNSGLITGVLIFYYLLVLTYMYFGFIHWFYDAFIVTNERYVSIDFDIFKGRTVTDIPLHDIIDVSEKVIGFLPSMFGYGNIEFKTISEKFIVLEAIPATTWFRDSFVDLIAFIRAKRESPKDTAPVKKKEEVKQDTVLTEKFFEKHLENQKEADKEVVSRLEDIDKSINSLKEKKREIISNSTIEP